VLAFAAGRDPLDAASDAARALLDGAHKAGITGPPVNVVELAKVLGLRLAPGNTIGDAAISPSTDAPPHTAALNLVATDVPLVIAYNPSRPRGRLRFSIAHEIAHSLFPDVAEVTRHRTPHGAIASPDADEWELELLCNVIAAELLMPDDAVAGLLDIDTDIDFIMEIRKRWDISTEALLRRLAVSSKRGLTMVAASRHDDLPDAPLRVDYVIGPEPAVVHRGQILSADRSTSTPYAVGQTVKTTVQISGAAYRLQAVGAPPYPGRTLPRVLGLLEPVREDANDSRIIWVTADITELGEDNGPVVIAHVVPNMAHAWGRQGVAAALARTFPRVAAAYRSWSIASPDNLALGHTHELTQELAGRPVTIVSMVAQVGFGPGVATRLNYAALHECLARVAVIAKRNNASVHLPRIGAGQAGGRWDLIESGIVRELSDEGVAVTVHTLPSRPRWGPA
jgi:Zn-dependent peptidase ImmA (M78 family)/O-acetyl-ADP-ribose deacetylase (regulator of RNase III)